MSCIVGWSDGTRVWLGGDSAAVSDSEVQLLRHPKVFSLSWSCPSAMAPCIMGVAGSIRYMQLLRQNLVLRPPEVVTERYVVTQVVEAIQAVVHAAYPTKDGWSTTESDERLGDLLIGLSGHLFLVDSDLQVIDSNTPYAACGAGAPYALGVLTALADTMSDPPAILAVALEVAYRNCASVRPPFYLVASPAVSGAMVQAAPLDGLLPEALNCRLRRPVCACQATSPEPNES